MAKRRITPEELTVGTVMTWDAYDGGGRLLLRKGQVISSLSMVEGLIERGLFAESDPIAEKRAPVRKEEPVTPVSLVLEARRQLQAICAPGTPKDGFAAKIFAIRELVGQACDLDQDAALAMTLLEREGRYSIRHSVDTAIAVHVVGNTLKMKEPELRSVVAAALTMNVSILKLMDDLQAQKEPLTDAQREKIRRHPDDSVKVLREYGVADELWLGAMLSHHEAIDGSGYREGRKGDDIPLAAQLVSLADIYCARISSRDYRPPLRPNAALRALFLDQGKKVRDGLASLFIKAIGVFPPGTPVRLENGEIAVVMRRGESASTPHVASIIGPRGMPLAQPLKRDTSCPTYGVREVVDATELGAPPSIQSLWGDTSPVLV